MTGKYDKLMTGIKKQVNNFKEHNVITAYRRHKQSNQKYESIINDSKVQKFDLSDLERNYGESTIAFEQALRSQIDDVSTRRIVNKYISNKNEFYSQAKKTAAIGTTVLFLSGVAALAVKDANDEHEIKITQQYDNTTGLTDVETTFYDTTETIFGLPVGLTDIIDNVNLEIYDDKNNLIDNPEFSEIVSTDEHGNSSISIDGLAPGKYTLKIQTTDSENDITTYTKELTITSKDFDEDGLSDYKEWLIGTDPHDSEDPYKSKTIEDIPKNDIKDTSGIMTYWDDSKLLYSFNDVGKIVDKIIEKSESPITTPMNTYELTYHDGGTLAIPQGYTVQEIYNDATGFIIAITPTDSVDSNSDATVLDLISENLSLTDAISSLFGPNEQKAQIFDDTNENELPGILSMNQKGPGLAILDPLMGDDEETIYIPVAWDTDPSEYTNNARENLDALEDILNQRGLVTYGSSGGGVTGGTTNDGSSDRGRGGE